MAIYKPKRVMEASDVGYAVCLWRFPDGSYIMDREQNYLSAQGQYGDKAVEHKMTRAALSMGVTDGEPFWLPGFRKITGNEWEDQMAALQDGEVPDAVDVYRQDKYGN